MCEFVLVIDRTRFRHRWQIKENNRRKGSRAVYGLSKIQQQEHGSLKGLSDTQDAACEEESTKIPTAILFDFLFSWAIWDDGENNYWIRQVDVKQKLRVPTKDGKTANNGKNMITPMKRKDKGCGGLPVNSGSQSSTPQVRSVTNSNFEHNSIHTIVKSFL